MPLYCRVTPQHSDQPPCVWADDEHNTVTVRESTEEDAAAATAAAPTATALKRQPSMQERKEERMKRLSSLRNVLKGTHAAESKTKVTFRGVYPASVEDPAVISNLVRDLVPAISSRENVTLLLNGHEKTGKTCLLEQIIVQVMEGLKVAISSAEEAHQENMSLDGTGGGAAGTMRLGGGSPNLAADAALGALKKAADERETSSPLAKGTTPQRAQTASGGRRPRSRGRSTSPFSRPGTSMSVASSIPTDKYALLFSGLGPEGNSLTMTEVRSLRPASAKPLLPKIEAATSQSFGFGFGSPSPDSKTGGPEKDSRIKQLFQRSTSPVRLFTGLTTKLGVRNGRQGGDHDTFRFNGDDTVLLVPHIPQCDEALKGPFGLRIAMWLCIDDDGAARRRMGLFHFVDEMDPNFTLRMSLNTGPGESYEQGSSLLTVRDSHGKTLELVFSDNLTDGKWHRLQVDFVPKENTITVRIDGRKSRVKILYVESPAAIYEERPKMGYFGCCLMPNPEGKMEPTHHLAGYVTDVFFQTGRGETIAHYPLDKTTSAATGFEEKKERFAPLAPHGTCEFLTFDFPQTAPSFDGKKTFVNMGTVGDFGLHLNAFSIEFSVRTGVTTEPMTVLGMADHSGRCPTRHPGFCVDLNADATGATKRCAICVSVNDYFGNGLCAVGDAPELFDDRWHNVSIRLVDAGLGRFKIKIDGRPVDLVNHHPQPTTNFQFVMWSQYLTVGCFNSRGKHMRHFTGSIHHVSLSRMVDDIDEAIASWPMDEGPGAGLAMDTTGHGFNGVFYNDKRIKGSTWYPVDNTLNAAEGGDPNAIQFNSAMTVVRHNNNVVTLAFVGIRPSVNLQGNVSEQIVDFVNGGTYDYLETVPLRQTNSRAPHCDERQFKWIPSDCFRVVTPSDYLRIFGTALSKSQEFHSRGHTVFVLRLGDAIFAAFDLASYSKSSRATYNPSQFAWTDAVTTFGIQNKMNRLLNHELQKLDKLVLKVGESPELYKRTVLLQQSTPTISDCFLVNLAMYTLLSGAEFARLFNVLLMAPFTSFYEGSHLLSVARQMQKLDRSHAAVLVQKNYRFRLGRHIYYKKVAAFDEAEARKDHAALQRRNYPADCKPKAELKALLVFATEFEKDRMMNPLTYGLDDQHVLPRLLDQLGYKCINLVNPCKELLLKVLESVQTEDTQVLVYFVGYCAKNETFTIPPTYAAIRRWNEDVETDARNGVSKEEEVELGTLAKERDQDRFRVEEILRIQAEEAEKAAKKKKKKKGAAAAPPPPPKPKPEAAKPAEAPGAKGGKKAPAAKGGKKAPAPSGKKSGQKPKKKEKTEEELAAEQAAAEAEKAAAEAAEQAALEATLRKEDTLIIEPHYDTHEHTYLILGDATTRLTADNTIDLDWFRKKVLGHHPARGHHSIFLYDCVYHHNNGMAPGVGSKTPMGCAGLIGSSSEELQIEYRPHQRFLLSYYLKRILQGCAVEAVKIGKHEPPHETTLEIAFHYLQKKMAPRARFSTAEWNCHWHGEYVGDVYIANKLLTKKEDRKKAKAGGATKRHLSSVTVQCHGDWNNDVKATVLSKLSETAKMGPIDVRRLVVDDSIKLDISGDVNFAKYHPTFDEDVTLSLQKYFSAAMANQTLEWKATANPLQIVVQPLCHHSVFLPPKTGDEDKRDPKQKATDFSVQFEKKAELIDQYVLGAASTILSDIKENASVTGKDEEAAAAPLMADDPHERSMSSVHSVATTSLLNTTKSTSLLNQLHLAHHKQYDVEKPGVPFARQFSLHGVTTNIHMCILLNEEECTKLDRAARAGLSMANDQCFLLAARLLTEREFVAFDNEEKLLAAEEARKQAEAKAAMFREAELRRKKEEERQKLEAQKEPMLDRIEVIRASPTLNAMMVDECFSLPLGDVYLAAIEAMTTMANRGLAGSVVSALAKVATLVLPSEYVPKNERLMTACVKLLTALAPEASTMQASRDLFPSVLRAAVKYHSRVALLWVNVRSCVQALAGQGEAPAAAPSAGAGAAAAAAAPSPPPPSPMHPAWNSWEPSDGYLLLSSCLPELETVPEDTQEFFVEHCEDVRDLLQLYAGHNALSSPFKRHILGRIVMLLEVVDKTEAGLSSNVPRFLSLGSAQQFLQLLQTETAQYGFEAPVTERIFDILAHDFLPRVSTYSSKPIEPPLADASEQGEDTAGSPVDVDLELLKLFLSAVTAFVETTLTSPVDAKKMYNAVSQMNESVLDRYCPRPPVEQPDAAAAGAAAEGQAPPPVAAAPPPRPAPPAELTPALEAVEGFLKELQKKC